ncbi:holo-ACP synthase [Lachnospiraceae bacterium LCP25S3_G4]
MIVGVGIDMIEIERVAKACSKQAFFTRCFSVVEQELVKDNPQRAAGNFAVKEAVSKVFGTGIWGFSLSDIEVLRDNNGKPYVNLYHQAKQVARELGILTIHISISNTNGMAIAMAVGEGE